MERSLSTNMGGGVPISIIDALLAICVDDECRQCASKKIILSVLSSAQMLRVGAGARRLQSHRGSITHWMI